MASDGKWLFQAQCPLCGEKIPVPESALLGKYVGQRYQPTGNWPLTFLCRFEHKDCALQSPSGSVEHVLKDAAGHFLSQLSQLQLAPGEASSLRVSNELRRCVIVVNFALGFENPGNIFC